MEIGVLILLLLMGLGGLIAETKVGSKLLDKATYKLFGIDVNKLED